MKRIFAYLLLIHSVGCSSKALDPGGLTITFAETQCSDPWVRPGSTSATGWPTDELRGQAILNYLYDNKVSSARTVRFVEITPIYSGGNSASLSGAVAICQACTCSSGRRIDVTINEADWEQASKLGFKRQ
ncbi:MAG: hypothetical protein LH609_01020 [Rudanella sp.]|nr:hypothetical protein [Rudanella sp.]